MHGILPKVVEITIKFKQQLRNNTILSRVLCLKLHSNVMLRFMVQALHSSTSLKLFHVPVVPPAALCHGNASSSLSSLQQPRQLKERWPPTTIFVIIIPQWQQSPYL